MDLNDISEYYMLHLFGQRNKIDFAEREGIYSIAIVLNLIKVHYFLNINGECWTKDISDSLKQKPGVFKRVDIGMHFLKKGRFVNEIDRDKYLGGRFVLTNKGMSVLDRYVGFLREKQKEIGYKIKESHKISCEMKENN